MNKQTILNSLKNKKVVDVAKTVGAAGVWIAAVVAVPGVFVYGIPAFVGGTVATAVFTHVIKSRTDQTGPITASADEETI
jgi:hypothetical protein